MLSNNELLDKCISGGKITCEDLGIPKWREECDGFVYECGGYTFYKHKDGFRDQDGRFLTEREIKRYELK